MSSVSAISAVGNSSSSAAYLPTLESLQSDLLLYSQYSTGNSAAAVDFKQLEYSIETRDLSDAQIEFAKLQRDSEVATTNPPLTINSNGTTTSGVSGDDGNATSSEAGSLVNVTA